MWTLAVVILVAGLAIEIASAWLTAHVRVISLGIVPIAAVAAALVAYFRWRANLRHRILVDAEDYRRAA